MKDLIDACKEFFADEYRPEEFGDNVVRAISELDRPDENTVNVRVDFVDETVSDWKLTLDEDGTILDGYCYNDVI